MMKHWTGEDYERKGNAHLNHAKQLEADGHKALRHAGMLSGHGKEGDQRDLLKRRAEGLFRKAERLTNKGLDWLETAKTMENEND